MKNTSLETENNYLKHDVQQQEKQLKSHAKQLNDLQTKKETVHAQDQQHGDETDHPVLVNIPTANSFSALSSDTSTGSSHCPSTTSAEDNGGMNTIPVPGLSSDQTNKPPHDPALINTMYQTRTSTQAINPLVTAQTNNTHQTNVTPSSSAEWVTLLADSNGKFIDTFYHLHNIRGISKYLQWMQLQLLSTLLLVAE